jgi:hypothetical protein
VPQTAPTHVTCSVFVFLPAWPGAGQGADVLSEVQCEIDPVCEVALKAEVASCGLTVVGWYHSHPTFVPVPSQCDCDNQRNYQVRPPWRCRRVVGAARLLRLNPILPPLPTSPPTHPPTPVGTLRNVWAGGGCALAPFPQLAVPSFVLLRRRSFGTTSPAWTPSWGSLCHPTTRTLQGACVRGGGGGGGWGGVG